ncbi:alcohol dehydrogenase catalytic domain-containing protein [bacterium]|nr:alcohol dehydrogenase catalytic domain-containing protein [bacterium]
MKIARTHAWGRTLVEEVETPRLERGDILVRVEACGLCGSDASRWYVEKKAPTVLGHEPAGVVVAARDAKVKEGDRVFVHHHVPCGKCASCKRGADTSCELFKTSRLDPGGFSELVRVPRDNVERDVLVLPESMSFERATFIEPTACTLRAMSKLRWTDDDVGLVVGLGAMGITNARALKERGARLVLGSDLLPERRERALAAKAIDHAIDATANVLEQVRALTGGRGADHVIVGPSPTKVIDQAYELVAPGGTLVLFSPMSPEARWNLAPSRLYFHEISITASYSCGPRETREALELISTGALFVDDLVSHRISLADIDDGMARTAAAAGDWLKAIVYPHGVPEKSR